MTNETISEKCETLYNKLNAFVTSVISRDVTPKISNLNTEVWGSDTQTGNSRIDTLNTNFNNLDGSITIMESDINNVKSDINTIESDVSNLQTSVNSLSDSITNLVQIQYIESGNKTISTGDVAEIYHTVSACPTGYSWLWVKKESFRVSQTDVNLNGTTFSYKLHNYTVGKCDRCYARGWLVFYPNTWNI